MLNPRNKSEHLIYGDILTPPAEFPILENALATTYSLDISALVSCMIPLAFSDDVNSRLFQNKVSTLTALRNLSEKLIVFCDPGQIKTLKTRNQEFAILLEKIVVPVMLKQIENVYPAFHPKLWLLQFQNEKKQHYYRLVVLSRNISYDRCYDVSLVLESYTEKRGKGVTERSFKKTQALLDYFEYLKTVTELSNEQTDSINKLVSDIKKELVGFKIDNPVFDEEDWDIFPLYENTFRKDRKLFEKTVLNCKEGYKKIFVMSPFISEDTLTSIQKSLIKKSSEEKRIKLITRQDSINAIHTEKLKDVDFYVLNPNAITGESLKIEDDLDNEQDQENTLDISAEEKLHDIHAKIFLTESKDEKELFIGSTNATLSAFNRNNELLVRLKSVQNSMSVDRFFKELNTEKENMFVPADLSPIQVEDLTIQKTIESAIRTISHVKAKGNVYSSGELYTIEIKYESLPKIEGVTIYLSPISSKISKELCQDICFENLELSNISEFYLLRVEKDDVNGKIGMERLIKIPTDNIPYEERDKALINQIITNKETFTEYVTLLLSYDAITTQIELNELKQTSKAWKVINTQMPLYETLLKASVTNPQAVLNLQKDLDLIDNPEIVSNDFKQLYENFREAIEEQK
ncbi:MAG: phospholipase D family protein [Treponema sp.]|nr:phospholipase D family protein [Treponema sp.]